MRGDISEPKGEKSVALKVVNVRDNRVFVRVWNETEYIRDQLMKTRWSS